MNSTALLRKRIDGKRAINATKKAEVLPPAPLVFKYCPQRISW